MVISIVSILGTAGVGYYRNFAKNVEVKNFSRSLVSDLKYARSLSTSGENSLKWGVHAVNGSDDYYELFSHTDHLRRCRKIGYFHHDFAKERFLDKPR